MGGGTSGTSRRHPQRRGSPACEQREKGLVIEQHQHTEVFRRDEREVARARRVVTGLLHRWGLSDEAPDFQLAVSELVSNALLHGSGEICVHLSCDRAGRVRLEVGDEGSDGSFPHVEERRIGGWGLRFVEQLAESWGSERRGRGTLVWMVKRVARGGAATDVGGFRLVSQA